ncbi:thioredoxin family protein [Methylibium sp.]|uniref:thioredoxin family protein n=1 Tax=Methylibium sp. TaxID=2067992 RepID=UPI003D1027E3
MSLFRQLVAAFAAVVMSLAASADTLPFEPAAFDRAVAAGGPVVVQFHADWCPTCKAQAPVVAELLNEPKMKAVKLFVANFDTERELKRSLKVNQQSTFVVFKGGKEVTRSTGQTQRAAIEAVFAKAL